MPSKKTPPATAQTTDNTKYSGIPGADEGDGDTATATIARAERVLARPRSDAAAAAIAAAPPKPQMAQDRPAGFNYANEVDSREDMDGGDQVIDMMAPNMNQVLVLESISDGMFREFQCGKAIEFPMPDGKSVFKFEGQLAYEKFMQEPVVIRIHSTKDKTEPPLVFVGVNGDNRWLERNKNYRVPRKFVERLLQAQEMSFKTTENPDPTVDNAMKLTKSLAASYEFSVIQDLNPVGRAWMRRMKREGT